MNTRKHRFGLMHAALPLGLALAVVLPLGAQQSDPSQANTANPNSFATPSPTAAPASGRDAEHKKHQRKHRGKRRQARAKDQNGVTARQRHQARNRQQSGSGAEQRRPQETDLSPAATGLEGKTAPENVAPQPDAVPQPSPH